MGTKNLGMEKLWVDIIKGNRITANGMPIEFDAPKIVDSEVKIQIEEEYIEYEVKFWEATLIMYVIWGNINMNAVKNYMLKFWNFIQLLELYCNDEVFFIARFKSHEDRDEVFLRGPYRILNMLVFITEWKPNFSLTKDMMWMVSIWEKLPKLPLHFQGARSMGKFEVIQEDLCTLINVLPIN